MTKTNFFTELHATLEGAGASMSITPKGDTMTVTFMPRSSKNLQPLTLTGNPDEFDEGFFENITRTLNTVREKGLIANHEEVEDSVEKAGGKKAATAKKDDKKSSTTPKAAPKPVDKKYQGLVKRSTPELTKLIAAEDTPEEVKTEVQGIIDRRSGGKGKEHQRLEIEVPEKPKLKHADSDMANFKRIITNQLHDAKDIIDLAPKKLERDLDEEQRTVIQQDLDKAKLRYADCEIHLKAIEAGTFGTQDNQTALVPVEVILTQLKSNS